MARIGPSKALTLATHGMVLRRGQPVIIENEGVYNNLVHSGQVKDLDKTWESISPAKTLPKLKAGTVVTVCREMGLGDVLMVLVVIRALKQAYPQLLFRYATGRNYVKLIEGLDFLESVQPLIDMDGHHLNVIELRGLSERHPRRMQWDRIDIFANYCGVKPTDYTLPLPETSDAERMRARDRLGSGSTITVAVRGSTPIRSWPMANIVDFALLAANAGWTVALVDNERQEFPEHPRVRNLTGELNLLEVKGILAESDFCISPDTGIQHLSEAVGTKCLAIYSVIPPELRITHYSHVKALWRRDLPCAPCWHRGCAPITCTSSITAEMVLRAIESWDMLELTTNPIQPFALVHPTTSLRHMAEAQG